MATAVATPKEKTMSKKSTNVNLRPLDDRVIIEPAEAETRTAGGIVLPDSAKEKPTLGTVIATGPGKLIEATGKRGQMSLKVGDKVYYGKYSGTEVEADGTKYVILRESDVLAVQN